MTNCTQSTSAHQPRSPTGKVSRNRTFCGTQQPRFSVADIAGGRSANRKCRSNRFQIQVTTFILTAIVGSNKLARSISKGWTGKSWLRWIKMTMEVHGFIISSPFVFVCDGKVYRSQSGKNWTVIFSRYGTQAWGMIPMLPSALTVPARQIVTKKFVWLSVAQLCATSS